MADRVQYKTGEGVAILSLAEAADRRAGPLDQVVRAEIMALLDRAERDEGVAGVVIAGQGRGFPGDVPTDEVVGGEQAPTLGVLCRRIETFPKPVVAALRGEIADGGFALALAAHRRVATRATVVRLNDLRRGLVPGAGVTQRLPRLIGAKPALDMMIGPRIPVSAGGAMDKLLSKIVERNVVGEAVQVARALAAQARDQRVGRAEGFDDPVAYQQEIDGFADAAHRPPEIEALLKCVAAAQLLPIEEGLAMEAALRRDLAASDRARGLIRSVAVERRGVRPGGEALTGPEALTLFGEAPWVPGLARRAMSFGVELRLAQQRSGGAAAMIATLEQYLEQEQARGRLDPRHRDRMAKGLTGGEAHPTLARADCVIEGCAAPLDAMAKLSAMVTQATGGQVPVMWTSNAQWHTEDMAHILGPRSFALALGVHLGAQLEVGELVVPQDADPAARARARAMLVRMGIPVIECRAHNGLVVETLLAHLMALAEWCVAQGAAPDAVDAALLWAVGPFQRADRQGMARQVKRFEALGWSGTRGGLFRAMIAAGREGGQANPGLLAAPEVVQDWRGGAGTGQMAAQDIRRRIWTGLFGAGLRLLERGVVRDAADIDLAGLVALGMPRASGGPMKAGELRGLIRMQRELAAWHPDDAELWRPSPLLDEMIKNGGRFGY